jgi:3-oxoacyl-[acyl-carrier-protein] synthase II
MRRVVVTGMGIVSPLGCGVAHNWRRLTAGESALARTRGFEIEDLACQVSGQVPLGQGAGLFDLDQFVPPKDQKKMDSFIHFAMGAADEAIKDSGIVLSSDEAKERIGVMIGAGIGGLPEIYETSVTLFERGPRRVSPFFVPASLINLASGQVAIAHDLRGPNHAVVTACSSGAHAIGDAARMIMLDDADMMVAGGAEASVCRIGIAGFCSARAMSTAFNDRPTAASRPYDRARDGFVMGEGAGMVVLEEYEHAKKRGATIHAELIGYGMSGDAFHMTAPHAEGDGAYRAMRMALKRAGIAPESIDYINAHGTSTPKGDEIELKAIRRLFGEHYGKVALSSTKSSIGHLLGAAGAVEAVYAIMAAKTDLVPPTLNLDDVSEECMGINLVPHKTQERSVNIALSNSFGFGGTNACLIFKSN